MSRAAVAAVLSAAILFPACVALKADSPGAVAVLSTLPPSNTPEAQRVQEIVAELEKGSYEVPMRKFRWSGGSPGKMPEMASGWIMANEKGETRGRSLLMHQAKQIIPLGRPAVPELIRLLSHDDMHIRYIVHFALEEISGESPFFPHFARPKHLRRKGWLRDAEAAWVNWYNSTAQPRDD